MEIQNGILSMAAITEYQEIYKTEFKKDISFDEAETQAIKLLRLFDIIYKPVPLDILYKE